MRQGPHHGAQKSTNTGTPEWRTSASKLLSVNVSTFALAINLKVKLSLNYFRAVYAHKEVKVDSSETTTAMLAKIRSIPLTAGTSSVTSTSFSSKADSIGLGALGTFLITGPAEAAATGATAFGKATVAEGGTASGAVAFGIGTGVGLLGAAPDCSFTVALGSAGEAAATTVSAPAFSEAAETEVGTGGTSLGATSGIPAEVAERSGTVCFPEAPAAAPWAEGKLGAEGGVKDTGFTGEGGAADIGAVTVTDGAEGTEGLRGGGGGGVPAPEILGGL